MLAGEPVDFSGRKTEEVGGLGLVASGCDDMKMGVSMGKEMGGGFGLGYGFDGVVDEGGELGPVGGDPGDVGQKVVVEGFDGLGWEKVGAGAGAEDGVEDDGERDRGLEFPAGLRTAGAEKSRYSRGDFFGAEHSNLDSGGRKIGGEVVERAFDEGWDDRMDLPDAEGGLHGESGEDGGAVEAVGGEGLEVGGNSGAARGVVAGDGEEGAAVRCRGRR